jgi:polyisoprenoid-binding protein YceI
MNKLLSIFLFSAIFILSSCNSSENEAVEKSIPSEIVLSPVNYKVDDNAFVVWQAKHNEDTEYAYQSKVKISDGSIMVEGGEITKAKFSFDIASLADTNLPGNLIKHLKGADYFNVSSFPEITFYVRQVVNGEAKGTLTVVGIEKEINFPISIEFSEESLHAKAEFDLDMLSFEFPHLVKTHQKTPEERKSGPSNIVHISFDISATPLN